MKLSEAVRAFDAWSMPWTFVDSVQKKLTPEDAAMFEAIVSEAARNDHWGRSDFANCFEVALGATKKKFPEVDEHVICSIVRASSYNWK